MSETSRPERFDRRGALSLLGLATSGTVLLGTEVPAQTIGMERRQERRGARHERRQERRTGRTGAAWKGVQGARSAVKSGATRTPT
jgi:hypothetical protein